MKIRKEQKRQTFSTSLLLSAYAGLAVIFVLSIFMMPKWMERFEVNYLDKVQVEIVETLQNMPTKELAAEMKELQEELPFEIAIYDDEKLIYRSVPGTELKSLFGKFNSNTLLFENQGDIDGKEDTLQVWFGIYRPTVKAYVESISLYQFILVFLAFMLLLTIILLSNRSLLESLRQIKETVTNLKDYRFDEIVENETRPTDIINEEMLLFTKSLQGDISNISQNYTELEYSLQLEKERLASMMMMSRGFIHDFKTPIHQMLLEISDFSTTDPATLRLLHQQMETLEHHIEDINEALQMVSIEPDDLLKLDDTFDIVALFKDVRLSLQTYLEKRNLWLDAVMPEKLFIKFNKVVARLIIHNLLSNALKYAASNHDIIFEMYVDEQGNLRIISENIATPENIERIQNSEGIFSTTEHNNQKDAYAYSSGQGLYLIKNLVLLNEGTYNLEVQEDTVIIDISLANIVIEGDESEN